MYEKITVVVLGVLWLLIAGNSYSNVIGNTQIGWEFFVIVAGSFALGWITYYAWHKEAHEREVPLSVKHTENKDTHKVEVGTTNVPALLPVHESQGTPSQYMPIGKYAVYEENDLQIVEGIGPKIDELFKNAGITTWKELSETSTERMSEILTDAGPRFQFNNPKTWAQQAELAAHGKWKELEAMQSGLFGGL